MNNVFQSCCPRRPHRAAHMRTALIAGCLAAAAGGCVAVRDRVEYIPGDRAVVPMKRGEPAPDDGWFVPPAVMQDVVPYLDEKFRSQQSLPQR